MKNVAKKRFPNGDKENSTEEHTWLDGILDHILKPPKSLSAHQLTSQLTLI